MTLGNSTDFYTVRELASYWCSFEIPISIIIDIADQWKLRDYDPDWILDYYNALERGIKD